MRYDDDDGQVDGDEQAVGFAGAAQFQPMGAGQPWLKSGLTPWHMWGNTQVITQPLIVPGIPNVATSNQMVRVNYKRPETWHWVFHTKLLAGPLQGLGNDASVAVHFDLIIGIGRSNISIPSFAVLTYAWQGPGQPPLGRLLYTTIATGETSFFDDGVAPVSVTNTIERFVAEDIQCTARVIANSFTPGSVQVEVSAHFSPVNHIRPDWFLSGVPEVKFPGGEIGGK